MADCGIAGQAIDHLTARKGVADEPEAALGVKPLAVKADNPGGFLAAMLQRVEAERGNRRGVGVAEDTEYAALFTQPIAVKVEDGSLCHGHRLAIISMHHSP
jgi:hypothetical protein